MNKGFRPEKKGRLKEGLYLLLILVLISGAILFYLEARIKIIKLGYQINELIDELEGLRDKNMQLRLERTRLNSLRRIEDLARRRLGLTDPKDDQLFLLTVLDDGEHDQWIDSGRSGSSGYE